MILCVGARNAGDGLVYPVSELALRHRAGVTEEATTGKVAYADAPKTTSGPHPAGSARRRMSPGPKARCVAGTRAETASSS